MTKKYNIIYADPPWQFNSVKSGGSMKSGSAAKYDVMSLEQLKALDVPALCEKDCVLIMWYVSSQPQEALDLVKAWGFKIKNMNAFIWRKLSTNLIPHFGMGYWTRGGAECALLAVRGKPKSVCKSIRQVRDEPVGEHSEKPGIFRDDIVKLCGDLPRLEMFARTAPAGWDVFGNEVESSVHIDGNEAIEPLGNSEQLAATECVEQSGTHINEGTKAPTLPTVEFTSDQIAQQLANDEIMFSGSHLELMLQLDGMFGKRDSYTTRQIRTAILALDEPGMVTKDGEAVEPVAQVDNTHVVELANEITEPAPPISEPATEITEEQNDLFEHFDAALTAAAEPVPALPEQCADAEIYFDVLGIPQNLREMGKKCEQTDIERSGYAIWAKGRFTAGKINGIGIRTVGDFKKGYLYEPVLVVYHNGHEKAQHDNWPAAVDELNRLILETERFPMGASHPFFAGYYNGNATYDLTVSDRLSKVAIFTLEQCYTALKIPALQSSVKNAVEARIRKLQKEQAAA